MVTDSIILMYCAGLIMGLLAGFFMHRSDYCMAGMFRDALLFGNTFMLRILFFQVIVTMILFETARRLGLLPLYPFPILASPSIANLIGGLVFGIGMVLAGGCVVGTLYKMGAGSVLSAVVFVGLLAGNGLFAELYPWWSGLAKASTFLKGSITIPQVLGIDPGLAVLLVALPSFFLFERWRRQDKWVRPEGAEGYIQPWRTAIVLAFLGLASYVLLGLPLGVTTVYAKIMAFAENLFAPEYVAHTKFFQALPLDVVHPSTGVPMKGGPGPIIDTLWFLQFPVVVGIILGSGFSAWRLGEFALRFSVPMRQVTMAFIGGLLLAMASRMTPSCNVWHLLGGLPIFAMQSLLFTAGLVPGAWLGGKILVRILRKQA